RRQFIHASAAMLTAAACARRSRVPSVATAGRLPLGFSTLGCPGWEWTRALDFAAAHGYAAIELRGIRGEMDLTRVPELTPARVAESRRQLAERGLRVACLGASAAMHEMDAAKRAAQMDEARKFIDLAREIGAPYVRVFGNQYVPGVAHEETRMRVAAGLRELGEYAHGRGVTVLIESHGDFTDSPSLREVLERASSPGVALLWDAHHTFVSGKEEPEETVRQLGAWIRHTHLKDSVPAGKDRRYVLTGTGDVPVRRQVEALAGSGYRGLFSFEWEKRWHPEIEEPEVAIAQFATVAGGYLRDAGVRAANGGGGAR
ncbi:MAG TPA: sugar phosphate isomerase/epimerase family protein, partial [Gemmatimonadaceae bacterium]|nr:sugar phosphate isomerase/epimerase family protein [Gemmatimonadaceae bacterium]